MSNVNPYGAFIFANGNGDTFTDATANDLMIYSTLNRILVGQGNASKSSFLNMSSDIFQVNSTNSIMSNVSAKNIVVDSFVAKTFVNSNCTVSNLAVSNLTWTTGAQGNTLALSSSVAVPTITASNVGSSNLNVYNAINYSNAVGSNMTVHQLFCGSITSNGIPLDLSYCASNLLIGSNLGYSGQLNFFPQGVSPSSATTVTMSNGSLTVGSNLNVLGLILQNGIAFVNGGGTNLSISSNLTVGPSGSNPSIFYPFQVVGTNSNGISAYFNGPVMVEQIMQVSDFRAKKNIKHVTVEDARRSIQSITVKKFDYVDDPSRATTRGTRAGFIAQELEKCIPECVTQVPEYIPNIYEMAKVNGRWIHFESAIHSLIGEGDLVKVYQGKSPIHVKCVSVLSDKEIEVDWEFHVDQVFVYGTRVDDFKVINTEPILALLVKCVQSLLEGPPTSSS